MGRAGRPRTAAITWLAVVPQTSGKLFESDTAIVISVEACKESSDAFRVHIFQRRKGGKLVDIEATVITGNFGEALCALGFDGGADGVAGSFPLFIGKFAVIIGIPLRDPVGVAGFAGIPDGLTFFFVDAAVFVGIELPEKLRKFISKGAVPGRSTGNSQTEDEAKKGKVFQFHH